MKENRPHPAPHLSLGETGERLALRFLEANGYRIVATNFLAPIGRSRSGRPITAEIDIIAYDESSRPHHLAFVEVKTRSRRDIAAPEAAVDRRKQRHLIRAARAYRRLLHLQHELFRYDVVSIVLAPPAPPDLQLLRAFFHEASLARRPSDNL